MATATAATTGAETVAVTAAAEATATAHADRGGGNRSGNLASLLPYMESASNARYFAEGHFAGSFFWRRVSNVGREQETFVRPTRDICPHLHLLTCPCR